MTQETSKEKKEWAEEPFPVTEERSAPTGDLRVEGDVKGVEGDGDVESAVSPP